MNITGLNNSDHSLILDSQVYLDYSDVKDKGLPNPFSTLDKKQGEDLSQR
jgi:hypothetical protein